MCSALMINSSTQRYSSFLVAGDAHENPPVRESTSGFSFPNVIRGPGLMRTATNDSGAESKFRLSGPRREARRRRVLAMADGHDDECRDQPRARDKIAGGRPVITVQCIQLSFCRRDPRDCRLSKFSDWHRNSVTVIQLAASVSLGHDEAAS